MMNNAPAGLRGGHGQAGKPDMQKVNWARKDLVQNPFTSPPPSLIFLADELYINWGSEAHNLTPLPLYGASISDECLAQSEGNLVLMFDSLRGWIPIADHLYRVNPTMSLRLSHVYDYAMIWSRAELALQQCLQLPRRYSHFDPRFRASWTSGVSEPPRGLKRAQKRAIQRSKRRCVDTAQSPALCSNVANTDARETLADLGEDSEGDLLDVSRQDGQGEEAAMEVQSEDQPDELNLEIAMRAHPIMLEWTTDAAGAPILVIAESSTFPAPRAGPGRMLLTALSKGALICPELSHGDQKCSRCSAGMCPPGIRYCTVCHRHWIHIHCAPLFVSWDGKAAFLCQGCKFYSRFRHSGSGPIDSRKCAACLFQVIDNQSGTFCTQCGECFHAVCAIAAHPSAEDCFPAQFFSITDASRPAWYCTRCSEAVETTDLAVTTNSTLSACRLPLLSHHSAPGIQIGEEFWLHLSTQHTRPLICRWELVQFAVTRHGADFRQLLQFSYMFPLGVDEKLLIELTQNSQCRLLSLQSKGHSGSHWLAFLLFGQTEDGGIPVILLQAVHPALQRQGLGRWGLHLLYRLCAKTRDLLLHTQQVDLGFYTRLGFVEFQTKDAKQRFKAVGGAVLKRSHNQGAVLDLKLSEVVASGQRGSTGPTSFACRWLRPSGLAFKTLAGTDVCFVATLLLMLLSVPQFVAHFTTYENRPLSTGAIIARCLAHLWRNQQDPDGPALVTLLRSRLQGDYGQAYRGPRSTKQQQSAFSGQHDVGDFENALSQALQETESRDDTVVIPGLGIQPASYAALGTSTGTEVRCCDKCGSQTFKDEGLTWIVQLKPNQPVLTLADLLDPILQRTMHVERPLEQPGCRRRFCTHRSYTLFTVIRTLAPVIQFTVNRGSPEITPLGVKALEVVDVPLRLSIALGHDTCSYLLRSVSFSSGGNTMASGHYTAGTIRGSQLEHCSHTANGTSLTVHTIPSSEFLRLLELQPQLPKDYVISTAWYSLAVGDEYLTFAFSAATHWANRALPTLAHIDRPASPSELGVDLEESLVPQPPKRRSPKPPTNLVSVLRSLVQPEQALRITRGDETLAAYNHTVREALLSSEEADVPVLFWANLDSANLNRFSEELQDHEALILNTMGSTSSRGRRLTLNTALQEIRRSKGSRDPFTSTNALPGGIQQTRVGQSLMTEITAVTGMELTGGRSLLVSEPGVTTPCHFHAPGVLNIALGFATDSSDASGVAQRHPEIGVVFPCAKQYVLFVTSSLESAGISLYNSDTTLSLASLVARVRGLSQTQRDLIRWFVCDLNGSDYNALYMPATMLHHVVTTRTSAKAVKGLYWGIASEVLPLSLELRQIILRKLERPTASEGSRRASVASLKHIAQQSTSSHSLALLQYMVSHPETTVRNFATWYDTRDWVHLWRTYNNAHTLAQDDHLQRAEQVLLFSVSNEVPKGALFTDLVAAIQHSRQTLSDALTCSREDRQAHMLRVQDSFQQGLAAVAEATVLLPLMRLTAHSQSFDDSARQSVGVDGDDDT